MGILTLHCVFPTSNMDPTIFPTSDRIYGNSLQAPISSAYANYMPVVNQTSYLHPTNQTNEGDNINHLTEADIATLITMCNNPSLFGIDLKETASVANSSSNHPKTPKRKPKAKVKKCSYCLVTFTDSDSYWAHYRTHLSEDKILACAHCAFITEHKHHFRYHIQQHAGIKPFKCNLCSYEGISKSMLVSHMRSHSVVHQYRCNDCSFGGKYIRQLLSHLKKTGHKPGQFLKPDGTPDDRKMLEICRENNKDKLYVKLKNDPPRYVTEASFKSGEEIKDVPSGSRGQVQADMHWSYHRKDQPFVCNQCSYGCFNREAFYDHMILYHGVQNKNT